VHRPQTVDGMAHPWLMTSGGRALGRLAADWCKAEDCTALASLRQAEDRQVAMNAAQDRYRLPQMRASDADRDGVVAALSEHFQTGRLTREELDERTGRALMARTLDELAELTADLPAIRPAGPAPVLRPRGLGYPLLAPVAAALAALAMAALVLGVGDSRHGWDWWWVIPAGLLFARRLAGRGRYPPGLRAELTAERTGHRQRNRVSGTVSDDLAGTCRSTSWPRRAPASH
jgi:Domain of unknown function (DUF1707)